MKNIDINKIDLNLLSVFRVLMRERSVSAAAQHLSVGQPAVSHALARLRSDLADPLLVRSGRAMEPTPFALELIQKIAPALDQIEGALRHTVSFDPASDTRAFRIAMSDDIQMSCLPEINRQLAQRMPGTKLIVQSADYRRASDILKNDSASLVVAYLDKLPAGAKIRKIRRVGYRVILAGERKRKVSFAEYCRRQHVLVTFAGDLSGYIDDTLQEKSAARSIKLSVSGFSVLPFLLRDSDLLATVPDHVAASLAQQPGLQSVQLPFASPRFDISIAWRPATDRDPGEKLLRRIIIDTVRTRTAG